MFRIFSSAARVRRAALFTAVLLASGCSDSTAPHKPSNGGGAGASQGASGTYSLRAIDRTPLPFDIHHGPFFDAPNHHFYNQLIVKVTGGAIELDPMGDFTIWIDYAIVADGQPSTKHVETDGTWKMNGDQVTVYVNGNATAAFSILNQQVVENMDLIQDGTIREYVFQR